jgi:hypothetical protein
MKELAELFGGIDRLLVIKYILAEPKSVHTGKSIAEGTGLDGRGMRSILSSLRRAGFVVEVLSRPIEKDKKKKRNQNKDESKWKLNSHAPYLHALESILRPSSSVSDEQLIETFSSIGRLQMLVLSGMFLDLDREEYPIDMLVVADRLNEEKADTLFDQFESEIGEEVRYVLLTHEEYEYRKEMRDKLLREFFSDPHRVVVNKLGRL